MSAPEDERIRDIAFEVADACMRGDKCGEAEAFRKLGPLLAGRVRRQGVQPADLELLADFGDSDETSIVLYELAIALCECIGQDPSGLRLSLADILTDREPDAAAKLIRMINSESLDQYDQQKLREMRDQLRS